MSLLSNLKKVKNVVTVIESAVNTAKTSIQTTATKIETIAKTTAAKIEDVVEDVVENVVVEVKATTTKTTTEIAATEKAVEHVVDAIVSKTENVVEAITSKVETTIETTIAKIETAVSKEVTRLAQIVGMNFEWSQGGRVATTQDNYLKTYQDSGGNLNPGFAAQTISLLVNDPWVNLATKIAPSNLTIRQLALIDLYKNQATNKTKIQKMLTLLSYNNTIWAEGYSYWVYSKQMLNVWVQTFQTTNNLISIINIMNQIDQNFVQTAYLRGDVWYPAPYGDLYNSPLEPHLQMPHKLQSKIIDNVIVLAIYGGRVFYFVEGRPIGLNVHIPANNSFIPVSNGTPVGFKYYTGYANKYPNKLAEVTDVLDPKRIQSTFSLF